MENKLDENILSEDQEKHIIKVVLEFVETRDYLNYWEISDIIETSESDEVNSAIVKFYEIVLTHLHDISILGEDEDEHIKNRIPVLEHMKSTEDNINKIHKSIKFIETQKENTLLLSRRISDEIYNKFKEIFSAFYSKDNPYESIPIVTPTTSYAELLSTITLLLTQAESEEAIKALDLILSTEGIKRFYLDHQIYIIITKLFESTDLDYMLKNVLKENNYKIPESIQLHLKN